MPGEAPTPGTSSGKASQPPRPAAQSEDVAISGWLMKRKRRRLPGWAKRWFVLYLNSTLCYYDTPESSCKGQVLLIDCTITKVPSHRLIIIDAGSGIVHIKAASDSEYSRWAEQVTAVRVSQACIMQQQQLASLPINDRIEKQIQQTNKVVAALGKGWHGHGRGGQQGGRLFTATAQVPPRVRI